MSSKSLTLLTLAIAFGLISSCVNRGQSSSFPAAERGLESAYQDPADTEKCTEIIVPDAFTPNSDGNNDSFKITTACELSGFKFTIFNRWGEEIYTTNDQHFSWDGTISKTDQLVPMGVFAYLCSFKFAGKDFTRTGDFTVLF